LAHAQTANLDRKADYLEKAAHWAKLAVEVLILGLQETAYSDRVQLDPESGNDSDRTPREPRLDLEAQAGGGCAITSNTVGAREKNPKNSAHSDSIWELIRRD